MKLLNLLREIFDNPYSFSEPRKRGSGVIEYKFKSKNNLDYMVYFDMQYNGSEWETSVSYETKQKGLGLTNEGDFQILSTVVAIVKDFIERYQPNQLTYDGLKEKGELDNPEAVSKRAKIYKTVIEKLKNDAKDYEVSYDGDTGTLNRKVPVEHKKGIYKTPSLDNLSYGLF